MNLMSQPPTPQQRSAVDADPALILDDFDEYLTRTYQPVLDAFTDRGLTARVTRATSGAYALTITSNIPGDHVDLTDRGRPLPARPADVRTWTLTSSRSTEAIVLTSDASLAHLVDQVQALLAYRH